MADVLHELIIGAFNRVFEQERAEEAEVRGEIAKHGTWWTASEIWKLRRQVKSLRKRLAELTDEA
jgi:hypothetical protein